MADEWDEQSSETTSGFGESTSDKGGFGFSRGRGRGGFGKRGGGGFGSKREEPSENVDTSATSNGWGGGGDSESGGSTFTGRGRRGGGGQRGFGGGSGEDGGQGGFGNRRGGFGRRSEENGGDSGGGRGRGFGRRGGGRQNEENGEGGDENGQSGGGFGRRGGFNRHGGDEEDGSGFRGRGRGRRGGFGGRRDQDGDENEDTSEGFRGRGRGRRGGFGGRRDQDGDENEDTSGGRGRGGRRGGFGGRRDDGDEGEGSGGFRDEGDAPRKTELYIPPAPPEDEEALFATMAAGINFDKYDEISVEVTGRDPAEHINAFEDCGFSETVMKNVHNCKYTRPTPVQKYAIPIIKAGRDFMACAQTGSGKTAAFLLPVITRLLAEGVEGASQGEQQSPQVLIVSPTRELTLQIYGEARKFVHTMMYRPVVVYGGTSVGHQLRQLEAGCNILVGTPGRLMDFLRRKKVLLDDLKVLILDEADRMLDMGFEPNIRSIVDEFNMPEKGQRQTLMFSATFPPEIQHLAADFLHEHIFLTVGVVGGTTSDIKQTVVEVDEHHKREKLQEILSESGSDRVLVFVETKRNADFLASYLSQENFPTTSIHGDRFQREREEALRDFRSGRSRVLVATSVAARGLDIPKVKHVVNFDLPNNIEEYVHRIGRTGRIGNQGRATAFFYKDRDGHLARALVKVLADAQQDVESFLEQAAEEAVGSSYGPAGGKFASKDVRFQGRRGNKGGDSAGFGDGGKFDGGFGESQDGGFEAGGGGGEDDW